MKIVALLSLYSMYFVVAIIFHHAKSGSKYEFSTYSSQAMSEILKFIMSFLLLKNEKKVSYNRVIDVYNEQMNSSRWCLGMSILLSLGYSINNQITFRLYTLTTPVVISLLKSAAPVVTAILTLLFMRQNRTELGWLALLIQTLGMIVAQYDPCKGSLRMELVVYVSGFIGLLLTSSCSVMNTELLKRNANKVSMHSINMTMYIVGTIFNLIMHNVDGGGLTLFENYTKETLLVILCNSLLGLAVTFVYKYADAIIKTLAQSLNICSLLVFGPVLFGSEVSFMELVGVSIVCLSTYIYVRTTQKALPPPQATKASIEP
jgi:drug/metabolite transporter (DMT)-like permease